MIDDQIETALIQLMRETARKEILPRYRLLGSDDVASKTSASDLVTIADRMSEQVISRGLAGILPDAAIVGEEAISEDPDVLKRIADADLSVIIDPIDGTWNFAKGLPLFGIILAVVSKSETVFGALYDPVMDDVTIARKGQGAFHIARNGERRKLNMAAHGQTALGDSTGILPLHLLPQPLKERIAPKLASFERIISYRCACHEYRILSEGSIDFSITALLNAWDHAAGELICREAGGYSAMMATGAPYRAHLREGRLLIARSRDIWMKVNDHLADMTG